MSRAERKAVCVFLSIPVNIAVIVLFFLKSVAMYQEQTPWKGTVYAYSPGLEVYTIQMKTDHTLQCSLKLGHKSEDL